MLALPHMQRRKPRKGLTRKLSHLLANRPEPRSFVSRGWVAWRDGRARRRALGLGLVDSQMALAQFLAAESDGPAGRSPLQARPALWKGRPGRPSGYCEERFVRSTAQPAWGRLESSQNVPNRPNGRLCVWSCVRGRDTRCDIL